MIRVLAALSLTLLPLAATAETVRVRAGEHAGFTRVVLEFDRRPDWTAGRVEDGYAVRLSGTSTLSIDTSRTFDLINRNRLAGLNASEDLREIGLQLACDCYATFYAFRDKLIVIDIREGRAGPDLAHQSPLIGIGETSAPNKLASAAEAFPSSPPSIPPDRVILPVVDTIPPRWVPGALPDVPDAQVSLHPADGLPDAAPDAHPADPGLAEGAVDIVAANIARASTQGLLQVVDPASAAIAPPDQATRNAVDNMTVDTAIERAVASVFDKHITSNATGSCIAPRDLDLTSWGDDSGLAHIGPLRKAAAREDGSLDPLRMRDLARAYLYLGFGAEARAVALHTAPEDRALINAMADIMDSGGTRSGIFADQFACTALAGLWRALSGPFEPGELPRDLSAILENFSAFPLHLRIHLGPILAERLRLAGLPEESRIALNTVIRAGNSSMRQALTSARLELTGTRADAARARLVALTSGTGTTAGEALLELLNDAASRGVVPDPKWVDDSPSLIRALRGTDVASDLAVAMLRGAIALDRFDETRRNLSEAALPLPVGTHDTLVDELLAAAVLRADDARFLRAEIAFPEHMVAAHRSSDLNQQIAARLLELGLFERADLYFDALPDGPEARVLSARIDLGQGRFDDALARLDGLAGDPAILARAEILAAAGRAAEAADAFFSVSEEARGKQNAMRAEQWGRLGVPEPPETSAGGAAGGNNELLRTIISRRAALEALLALSSEM